MPRRYPVTFERVSVSAAQDLVQVKGAAGKTLRIISQRCKPADGTLPTAMNLAFRGRFLPATVTDGSGGTSATIGGPFDPGDAAPSFTAKLNNTTKATTSGTASVHTEGGEHEFNGYEKVFPDKEQPVIGPSESYVFELLNTPAATAVLSGEVIVEESGG